MRALSRAARPYLKAHGLLRVTKAFNKSALAWEPANERVVVLAPHMDDEIIGCGGTLTRHVAHGADVTVVFLTDGRHGGALSESQLAQGLTIASIRKAEAHRALAEVGVRKIVFLDAEDGKLGDTPEMSGKLREVLVQARPDIVYVPFFLEEHPDHRAASPLLAAAVNNTTLSFHVHGYEVWTPLFPNCFVPIDDVVETKRAALQHYASQLADADYLHTSFGLNAYRSSALIDRKCHFAEAFCVLPLQEYLEMYRSFGPVPASVEAAPSILDRAPA
jgi:LmbE family N-acetylglucosaminyl deacetylase